ncbi:HMG-Y-related A-like [Olea europaea subsp. europaea]|uniref:HMG-Y-related A-like n=1 Tax=Olea europaea subsp. europaea TaxID=158383 RepID=A0A8S0QL30_OLEEU|nr:HMG-Y-related A-like [Olea europaea subsp. europaea]
MATEEVSKPPAIPPYRQMIMEALDSLKQKEGANKTSISEYLESKYKDLPAAHVNLLSAHLTTMKDSGELLFIKNNYLRPGAEAPPKRGRGRPRKDPNSLPEPKKPKPAAGPQAVSKTGRPRGRPRKVKPQTAPNGLEG